MQETVNQESIVTNEQEQPKEEKLFTQEQCNEFFNKRYSGMMSQMEELKSKAAKFDEMEEANKTELQRQTEKAEKLQLELDSLRKTENLRALREKVAKEKGIPATSLSLITGETEEACNEQADAILAMITPGTYPQVPDRGEVSHTNKGTARDAFSQWANMMNN